MDGDKSFLQNTIEQQYGWNNSNFIRCQRNEFCRDSIEKFYRFQTKEYGDVAIPYYGTALKVHKIDLFPMFLVHCIKFICDTHNFEEISSYGGYNLFYLCKNNWSLIKLLVNKIKECSATTISNKLLFKALNIRNSDNDTILHNICKTTDNQFVINWYLTEVIPSNHPILFEKDNVDGYSALFLLCKNGLIYLAQKLLNKITDKKEKLKLIEMKNNENESVLDYAKSENIPNFVKFVENEIENCK